ncbi:hypothetical protein L6164_000660 [Bauhinia variegata]|uniref:Uncharacterized protein n=1 Tax=Bauhinia variegata TaxID=167791 RepID=A0ACB9Q7S8_BAUVA|nr:hypothetical protein L6164_000660 [Bauhinia variegata]
MDDIDRLLLFGIFAFYLFSALSYIQNFVRNFQLWVCRVTFKRISKKRSTEKFSGIPYVMTLFYCLVSAWNGQLAFSFPHNMMIALINCIGAVIETVYVFIFIKFAATKEEKTKFILLFTFLLAWFLAFVTISRFTLHGENKGLLFGFAVAIASIFMYASPLLIMRLVIKTKSVEFMPFFLSLSMFLYGICWVFSAPKTLITLILYSIIYVSHEKAATALAEEEPIELYSKNVPL